MRSPGGTSLAMRARMHLAHAALGRLVLRAMKNGQLGTLILALVSTLGSVTIVELLYRMHLERGYRVELAHFRTPYQLLPDHPLAFRLPPSHQGVGHFAHDKTRQFRYQTNADGFRTRQPTASRPSVPRVAVVGDSYTFGWGVEDTEAYPQRAEALLRQTGRDVEVLNLGVPGYNTEQEYYVVEEMLPKYRPDIIVLGYVMNDAEPQITVPASPAMTYRYARLWFWEDWKEVLAQWFGPAGGWLSPRKVVVSSKYTDGFRSDSQRWRESKEALVRIADLCRRGGAQFVIMILPDVTQALDGGYPYTMIHEKVSEWGRELGVETIDVLPLFRGRDHLAYMIIGDDHPNARAHEEFARVLRDTVVRALAGR